jgi:CSLREA domain-containing protein
MKKHSTLTRTRMLILWLAPFALSAYCNAAVFRVNSTLDQVDLDASDLRCQSAEGFCTLRAAIQQANADVAFDEIILPSGTYDLSLVGSAPEDMAASGDLDIRHALWLHLDSSVPFEFGASVVTSVSFEQRERIFDIQTSAADAVVLFDDIQISFGYDHSPLGGGGVLLRANSRAKFERVLIYANDANVRGGAVSVFGALTMNGGIVFDNHPTSFVPTPSQPPVGGGAFYVGPNAFLALERIEVDSNEHQRGGAIYAEDASTVQIRRSSIQGNGGAPGSDEMFFLDGAVQLSISNSYLLPIFGLLSARGGANASLVQTTLARSTGVEAGAPVLLQGAATKLSIANSALEAWSLAGCASNTGIITSLGGNVFEQAAPCAIAAAPSDRVVNDLALASVPFFVDVRGITQQQANRFVSAPTANSPLIDAGLRIHCAQADIVGAARPAPGRTGAPARCDAGAFEWPLFHMLIDGFDDVSTE